MLYIYNTHLKFKWHYLQGEIGEVGLLTSSKREGTWKCKKKGERWRGIGSLQSSLFPREVKS